MKNKFLKKIVMLVLISVIFPYIYTTFSYAASESTFFQGLRLEKRYMPDVEYWVTGTVDSKVTELKVPPIASDNIPIKAIDDNTKINGVFQGNIWLEKVDLSESRIEEIGARCFYNCQKLKQYINSPYLKTVYGYAFQNANLESITFNEGLESIRPSAFEDAFSNENKIYVIDIPDTVTEIYENAFKVTNKNYRVILVGEKASAAEEYCKTDSKCTFIQRGDEIPTEEDLIQQEIEKEKKKLFINKEFTYQNYNNTNKANITKFFGWSASTLETSNMENFSDIIEVEDGFIVIGTCYIDKYNIDSSYFEETFASKAKGNDDGIIVKYDYNLSMEWFQSFGGSLGDRFGKIYKTKDGGYLVLGTTCSSDKDLQGINYDTSKYCQMIVKYDRNFKVVENKMISWTDALKEYQDEILEDEKGKITSGTISLDTISDGVIGVLHGINGYEMNTLIRKYDDDGHLEWKKTFDRDSNKTDDNLTKVIETDDGYIFIGSSSKSKKNSRNETIIVEDAIIVKYNKPYDQIMIHGMLQYYMNVGEQKTPEVFYVPWEDVTIGDMQWTSENEEIATVDYKGNIVAKGEGLTKVNLNIRGKTAQIIVNVTDPTLKHIEKVVLDKTQITMFKDNTEILSATITPIDTTDSKEITWTSSNLDVAKVDNEGRITAVSEGTAIITAKTINGKTANCTVTVKENVLGDINGDGKINTKDWNRMYEYINETQEFNEDELLLGDLNKDGKVNIKDWNRMYDHITEVDPLL